MRANGWRRDVQAASDIVGNLILLAITVVMAGGFFLALIALPGPTERTVVQVQAFVLPSATNRLVIEHQGGTIVPLNDVAVILEIGATTTSHNVGARLAAADPKWSVVSSAGASKLATQNFVPGDQIRYTDNAILTQRLRVSVANEASGTMVYGAVEVQAADATAPTLSSARTITTTVVEVTFTEEMDVIAAADFTVGGIAPASARLVDDGTKGELTMGAAVASGTPAVSTTASPTGTQDLAGNLVVGGASVAATDALSTTSISVNVIYPSEQSRNDPIHIGMNIVNPTPTSRSISSVSFSVTPTLGSGNSLFFRTAVANLAGSDISCTWSGASGDTVTCTPGAAVTLPADGVIQAGLSFTTSDRSTDGSTVLTASATLTTPSATITSKGINVRHEGSNNNAFCVRLLAEASQAGSERAGFTATGGSAKDFYFEWDLIEGDGGTITKFNLPAGWTSVSVPTGAGQGAIDQMSITIQHPTSTQAGFVEVGQLAADRDFFFRATPPSGADTAMIEIEMTGVDDSDQHRVSTFAVFGVQIT